jgi:hypothetical protein
MCREWWGNKHPKAVFFFGGVWKDNEGIKSLVKGCKVSTQGGLMFVEGGCNVELNKGIWTYKRKIENYVKVELLNIVTN